MIGLRSSSCFVFFVFSVSLSDRYSKLSIFLASVTNMPRFVHSRLSWLLTVSSDPDFIFTRCFFFSQTTYTSESMENLLKTLDGRNWDVESWHVVKCFWGLLVVEAILKKRGCLKTQNAEENPCADDECICRKLSRTVNGKEFKLDTLTEHINDINQRLVSLELWSTSISCYTSCLESRSSWPDHASISAFASVRVY